MLYCFDLLTFCIADYCIYKTIIFLIYPLQKMRVVAVALLLHAKLNMFCVSVFPENWRL